MRARGRSRRCREIADSPTHSCSEQKVRSRRRHSPSAHAAPGPLSISGETLEFAIARGVANSRRRRRRTGGIEIAYNARRVTACRVRVQSNSNNYEPARWFTSSGRKPARFTVEQGARGPLSVLSSSPPPRRCHAAVVHAAVVNANCIIKI